MIALAEVISVMATGGILGQYGPVWKEWDDQPKLARIGDLTVKIGIVQGGESSFQPAPPSFPLPPHSFV